MKTTHPHFLCCLPLLLCATTLWAQTTPIEDPVNTAAASVQGEALRAPEPMGEATRSLLAQQRQGVNASAVERPIEGQVAARSHERYLKTFEAPQPEWFDSRLSEAQQ